MLNPVNLSGNDTNDNSIVLSLSYGQVDFLFTGDAEQEAEASMLAAGHCPPDVDILKVGHHGSRTASSMQFLQVAKPEYAIYMAGKGNSYGHPHQETINALREVGAEIYGTDTMWNYHSEQAMENLSRFTRKSNVHHRCKRYLM